VYPRTLAHVGVAVPDLEEAVEWYREVLGWTPQTGPRSVDDGDGYAGRRAEDVLGKFREMRVATLLTGNGIGVEVFEFTHAGTDARPVRAARPGRLGLTDSGPLRG
jgi:catechol 2,3-dioxygenase-like lactoylglutathione lyase family enzyme